MRPLCAAGTGYPPTPAPARHAPMHTRHSTWPTPTSCLAPTTLVELRKKIDGLQDTELRDIGRGRSNTKNYAGGHVYEDTQN
jgi:hypothetical protein